MSHRCVRRCSFGVTLPRTKFRERLASAVHQRRQEAIMQNQVELPRFKSLKKFGRSQTNWMRERRATSVYGKWLLNRVLK